MVFSTIETAATILVSVPGWAEVRKDVCFESYLVLNFIPLRLCLLLLEFIIESPRVERVSLNPPTVSM